MKKLLLVPALVLSALGCAPADVAQPPGATGGSTSASGGATSTGGSNGGTGGTNGGTGGTTTTTGGTTGSTGGTTGSTGGRNGATGGTTGTGGRGTGGTVAGTGGAGGAPSLLDVARPLNGQMLLGPCKANAAASVCDTRDVGAACPTNADRALAGVLTTDRTIMLGGTAGTAYTITLHVQGEVESKQYTGGMDQNSTAQNPRADGFCTGGTPTTADNYNVYMIRVTNPGSTARTDYFLNSLQAPGVSNHTTYGMDYTAQIKAMGGAMLRLVAGDSNCQMIKNCGPTVNDGSVCAGPIIMTNIEPEAISINPAFNFNTAYNGQWVVTTVKNVTSP